MEPTTFRAEFKRIVYLKGEVTAAADKIRRLEGWNKNGSHDNAIKLWIFTLGQRRDKLKEALKGKAYSDWLAASKKLSVLQQRQKNAKKARPDIEEMIKNLTI